MTSETYRDEYEAIALAIADSGKPFKLVAMHVFPNMKSASAYARLKACCDPKGDQRLSLGQVIQLMQFCERYDPLYYACDVTEQARPGGATPEDDAIKLVEVINGAASTMERAMKQLDHIKARGGIRAVA